MSSDESVPSGKLSSKSRRTVRIVAAVSMSVDEYKCVHDESSVFVYTVQKDVLGLIAILNKSKVI